MSRLAVDLARALDPVQLARGVGMEPDAWQADVLRSDHPRLLLNCCRQSGKSVTCATKAVHVAVYEPDSLTLLLSPSQRSPGANGRPNLQPPLVPSRERSLRTDGVYPKDGSPR